MRTFSKCQASRDWAMAGGATADRRERLVGKGTMQSQPWWHATSGLVIAVQSAGGVRDPPSGVRVSAFADRRRESHWRQHPARSGRFPSCRKAGSRRRCRYASGVSKRCYFRKCEPSPFDCEQWWDDAGPPSEMRFVTDTSNALTAYTFLGKFDISGS